MGDVEIETEEEIEEAPSEQIEQLEEKHYQKLIHKEDKLELEKKAFGGET